MIHGGRNEALASKRTTYDRTGSEEDGKIHADTPTDRYKMGRRETVCHGECLDDTSSLWQVLSTLQEELFLPTIVLFEFLTP